jgi:16S rRNA G966 N2-methylase RsmD
VQQSHFKDGYYPLNYLDLFAGSGGFAAEVYDDKMADGLRRSPL